MLLAKLMGSVFATREHKGLVRTKMSLICSERTPGVSFAAV